MVGEAAREQLADTKHKATYTYINSVVEAAAAAVVVAAEYVASRIAL